jgi:hypothetical protein
MLMSLTPQPFVSSNMRTLTRAAAFTTGASRGGGVGVIVSPADVWSGGSGATSGVHDAASMTVTAINIRIAWVSADLIFSAPS